MRNTVRFQSAAFNTTEPREHFINPDCFGDDVAAWLKPKLEGLGYQVDDPDQEDWGWYLTVRDSEGMHDLSIGHTGDVWQIVLERQRSFGQWLLRKSKAPASQLVQHLHDVLSAAPEVHVVEWLQLDDRGRESDAAEQP